ncbi:MAG: hypothetical protein KCHDKBKB_03008 [Elusimicrobia bacterium]|nr:hypothetical protein [Elusimicrobiota bacterium]
MKQLLSILSVAILAFTFVIPPITSHAADVTVTAGNVVAGANAKTVPGLAGATITAGQIVYYDSSASSWKLADADLSAAASGSGGSIGLALNGASSGQPITVLLEDDDLTPGGTLTMTAPIYVLSGTAGGIAPIADLAAADYPVFLGIAKSANKMIFRPVRGPVVVAAP